MQKYVNIMQKFVHVPYLLFFFQTEAALMYDAVYTLAHALQQVDHSTPLRLVNLTCEGDQAWAFGSSLYNYLNLVSVSHP